MLNVSDLVRAEPGVHADVEGRFEAPAINEFAKMTS